MRIDYNIENRDTVLADLAAQGKRVVEDNTINLVNGVLQDCYCIVEDAEVTP
jgi:hypothetical protein